jgi:hypothetical protein
MEKLTMIEPLTKENKMVAFTRNEQQALNNREVIHWIHRAYESELNAPAFTYDRPDINFCEYGEMYGDSLLDLVPSFKDEVLASYGLVHKYTVRMLLTNMLHQYLNKVGLTDAEMPATVKFITHTNAFSNAQLSETYGCDHAQFIDTATFKSMFSRKISPFMKDMLNVHYQQMPSQDDHELSVIRKKIRFAIPKPDKNNPVEVDDRIELFFQQMQANVIILVDQLLQSTNSKFFLDADSWYTIEPIDVQSLVSKIESELGLTFTIDHTIVRAVTDEKTNQKPVDLDAQESAYLTVEIADDEDFNYRMCMAMSSDDPSQAMYELMVGGHLD